MHLHVHKKCLSAQRQLIYHKIDFWTGFRPSTLTFFFNSCYRIKFIEKKNLVHRIIRLVSMGYETVPRNICILLMSWYLKHSEIDTYNYECTDINFDEFSCIENSNNSQIYIKILTINIFFLIRSVLILDGLCQRNLRFVLCKYH